MSANMKSLWRTMLARCSNPKHISFKYYGAKGISVCARWAESYDNFIADMGPRPPGTSIERNDSSKNYEPGNCRWATIQEQNSNKGDTILIEYQGKKQPLAAWAREVGMSKEALHYRIKVLKMAPEMALTLPVNRHGTRRAIDNERVSA